MKREVTILNYCKSTLLNHYHQYPRMQIEDFVKLIYQMVFGPKHYLNRPTLEQIKILLRTEIEELSDESTVEDSILVGQKFARVHLNQSFLNDDQFESLATMFIDSMMIKLDAPLILDTQFKDCLYEFEQLVNSQMIILDFEYCHLWIKKYLENGIKPISHSEIYRNCYHPHYRVIHQSMLKNRLL